MDQPPPASLAHRGSAAPAPSTPSAAVLIPEGPEACSEPTEDPPSRGLLAFDPPSSLAGRDPDLSPWTPLLGFAIALSTVVVPLGSVIAERPRWLPPPPHGSEPTGGLSGARTGQPDR